MTTPAVPRYTITMTAPDGAPLGSHTFEASAFVVMMIDGHSRITQVGTAPAVPVRHVVVGTLLERAICIGQALTTLFHDDVRLAFATVETAIERAAAQVASEAAN